MTEKNMWNLSPEEALKACQTSEQGLSTEQAEKIRLEAGENMLKEGKKKSPFQVFLDQFKDLMVVILIGAAIISMFSGNEELLAKASIFSALELYLDFINIFLYLLRLFARNRD